LVGAWSRLLGSQSYCELVGAWSRLLENIKGLLKIHGYNLFIYFEIPALYVHNKFYLFVQFSGKINLVRQSLEGRE
jgi:hypothetical protein